MPERCRKNRKMWESRMALKRISRPCILAVLAAVPTLAMAQAGQPAPQGSAEATSDTALGDIIVTAQKRAENLQNVPVAVTAISGDDLQARGISDVQALARLVPNVTFSDKNGEARINLRGLGFDNLWASSAEPRVAYHIDGAYVAQSANIFGTFFDVGRVEVNRGPQGTLFGRNAVAGTVNVVTRDPTDVLSGYLNAEVGNYSTANVGGAISGPLSDGISARIAFQTRNHSGYDYNVTNDVDINNLNTQAARAKLKFDRGGPFSAVFSADYFRQRDRSGAILLGVYNPESTPVLPPETMGGIVRDGDPRHDFSDTLPKTNRTSYGFALDAKLDIGNGFTLSSLTSYRHSKFFYQTDIDLSNLAWIFAQNSIKAKQVTEEVRLNKDFDRGNLVLGVYFFSENYQADVRDPADAIIFGAPAGGGLLEGISLGGHVRTRAIAGFGQFTYELTDTTKLTVGARYGWERKRKTGEYIVFNFVDPYDPQNDFVNTGPGSSGEVTFRNFSPRVTIEQQLGDNQLIYATFAKGYKTGGFNLGQPQPSYAPENLTDYEVGFKLDLLDRKLRLNGSAFYYNYKDLQVTRTNNANSVIMNAARAKIYGAELEMKAVLAPGLEIDAAGALLKTKFTSFDTEDPSRPQLGLLDLAGNRLPSAPKYTFTYGAQYSFETDIGQITLRGDGRTTSDVYFDQFNVRSNSERAKTILDASISWKDNDDRFSAALFVRNLTDTLSKNGSFVYGGFVGYPLAGNYDPPRTYGARLGVNF
jgi:iron complex outermembrane receptor protein